MNSLHLTLYFFMVFHALPLYHSRLLNEERTAETPDTAIRVDLTYSTSDLLKDDKGGRSLLPFQVDDSEESLFPSIVMETTIMSLPPAEFVRYRARDYLEAIVSYMLPEVVRVSIISVHGEDGGSGVVTTITFLTGGQKAAEKFRETVLTDWDEIQAIWPAASFGKGCHMEGFSFPCVTTLDGTDPSDSSIAKYKLESTLQIWAALTRRPPSWVTDERSKEFNRYLKQAMKPAASVVTSDWFVDDNDYYLDQGGRIKPVFNVQVKSDDKKALDRLQAQIRDIMTEKASYQEIWPEDSGFGPVHIEGETTIHPHFCWVGTIPDSIQKVSPPPPPKDAALRKCSLISTVAQDENTGSISFSPTPNAKYCKVIAAESENPVDTAMSWKLDMNDLTYPLTRYSISDLVAGVKYDVDVSCESTSGVKSCSPGRQFLWTPTTEEFPGITSIIQIPPNGGSSTVVTVQPPSSDPTCTNFTLVVKNADGSVMDIVQTSKYTNTLSNLNPGSSYTLLLQTECGKVVQTSVPVSYTPQQGEVPNNPSPPPKKPIEEPQVPPPPPGATFDPIQNIEIFSDSGCNPVAHIDTDSAIAGFADAFVNCSGNSVNMTLGAVVLSKSQIIPISNLPDNSMNCTFTFVAFNYDMEELGRLSVDFTTGSNCTDAPSLTSSPNEVPTNGTLVDVHPHKKGCDASYFYITAETFGEDPQVVAQVKAVKGRLHDVYIPNILPGVEYNLTVTGVCPDNSTTPSDSKIIIKEYPPPPPPAIATPPAPQPMDYMCELTEGYPGVEVASGGIAFKPPGVESRCLITIQESETAVKIADFIMGEKQLSRPVTLKVFYGLKPGATYNVDLTCQDLATSSASCRSNITFTTKKVPEEPSIVNIQTEEKVDPPGIIPAPAVQGPTPSVVQEPVAQGPAPSVVQEPVAQGPAPSTVQEPVAQGPAPSAVQEPVAQGPLPPSDNSTVITGMITEQLCDDTTIIIKKAENVVQQAPVKQKRFRVMLPAGEYSLVAEDKCGNKTIPSQPFKIIVIDPTPSGNPPESAPAPAPSRPLPPIKISNLEIQYSRCHPWVSFDVFNAQHVTSLISEKCDGDTDPVVPYPYQVNIPNTVFQLTNEKPGQRCVVTVALIDKDDASRSVEASIEYTLPEDCVDKPSLILDCLPDVVDVTCRGDISPPTTCKVTTYTVTAKIDGPAPGNIPFVKTIKADSVDAQNFVWPNFTPGLTYIVTLTSNCDDGTNRTVEYRRQIPTIPPPPPPPPSPPNPPPPPSYIQLKVDAQSCASYPIYTGSRFRCQWQKAHGGCCHCPSCHLSIPNCPFKDCGLGNGFIQVPYDNYIAIGR